MQIIQLTKFVDPATFTPKAVITFEVSIEAMQDQMSAHGDAGLERFVGHTFLTALHAFYKQEEAVQDAEAKQEEKHDDTVVQQES